MYTALTGTTDLTAKWTDIHMGVNRQIGIYTHGRADSWSDGFGYVEHGECVNLSSSGCVKTENDKTKNDFNRGTSCWQFNLWQGRTGRTTPGISLNGTGDAGPKFGTTDGREPRWARKSDRKMRELRVSGTADGRGVTRRASKMAAAAAVFARCRTGKNGRAPERKLRRAPRERMSSAARRRDGGRPDDVLLTENWSRRDRDEESSDDGEKE